MSKSNRPRFLSLATAFVAALTLAACSLGVTSGGGNDATPGASTARAAATVAATTGSSSIATLSGGGTSTTGAPTVAATATLARAGTVAPATANTNTALATASVTGGASTGAGQPIVTGQGLSVPEINRRARPAIVQITNNQRQTSNTGITQSSVQVPTGVGTGFIFDKRGYIITNNHVVEGATSLTVATTDDKTYDGKIVGAYPDGDLAVVQINCNGDCPTVPLGDSGKLQVGESVVAIGNALALEGGPTVTTGVVSALGRTQQEPSDTGSGQGGQGAQGAQGQYQQGAFLTDLIQTDAAINPGNSGGPLFNMQGEVVGINTLGAGQAEPGVQAQGIGFAISINTAKSTADALVNNMPVPRPFIGISYGTPNPQQAAQAKIPYNTGAIVAQVSPGSPAEKAGIQRNDIILKMDGQVVRGESGVPGILLKHKPGDTISVVLQRNGQQQTVQVTLAQAQTTRK